MRRKKAFFSISAVAKMFSVHQQTIRLYEKEGFISPKRSEGNTRLFSEEDINQLEQIIYLTHQLGINLAGVEMILKLQKKIKKMQKEMNKIFNQNYKQESCANKAKQINNIFENAQRELEEQSEYHKEIAHQKTQQLIQLKKNRTKSSNFKENSQDNEKIFDIDDWEIDYDE